MRSFSIPDFQTFIWPFDDFVEERESHRLPDFHTNLRQFDANFSAANLTTGSLPVCSVSGIKT